jgi:hypothetical protein
MPIDEWLPFINIRTGKNNSMTALRADEEISVEATKKMFLTLPKTVVELKPHHYNVQDRRKALVLTSRPVSGPLPALPCLPPTLT